MSEDFVSVMEITEDCDKNSPVPVPTLRKVRVVALAAFDLCRIDFSA